MALSVAVIASLGAGASTALANCGVTINLTPPTQTHVVGQTASVTAEVLATCKLPTKAPYGNVPVTFTITSGPNAGQTFTGNTDEHGMVTLSYTSATGGTDTISATSTVPGGSTGTSNSVTVVWTAPPPLTYTGYAYDASASLTLPLLGTTTLAPVNPIGPVSTTGATNSTNTIATLGGPIVTAGVLKSTVTTATPAGTSAASASVDSAGVASIAGLLPVVSTTEVSSTSTTTCAGSVGTTTIAYLKVGGTVVVGGPGTGALIPAGAVPANTTINLGLVKVVLNEQLPITGGLAVNAIHISVNILGIGSVDVKVVHAESDIHNC